MYDLIQRIEGGNFQDSLTRAEEILQSMPANFQPSRVAPKLEFDVDACATFVEDGHQRARENDGWLCVVAGLADAQQDASDRKQLDTVLRDKWRWGVDGAGNIIVPHYDVSGALTGAKIRGFDGRKWAFTGSKFPALYGSWHQRQFRCVLLCEGESDAIFAAIQNPNVDVLALPAGAARFNETWTALEADIYFLAFDADDAGQNATAAWLEALEDKDVRVCRLPRGHDIRSSRPSITSLLRHAVRPQPSPTSIVVDNDRFERMTSNGPRPLCSWYCLPTARLEPADETVEPALEVELRHNGQVTSDVLKASDLHSASRLRTWAGARSLDCMASDNDVQQLNSLLLAQSAALPEVFQSIRVGAHQPPARYRYTGRAIVTPGASIGRLPWRYVGPAEARDHVHLSDAGLFNWDWLRALLELHDPDVITPLLAWLVAATRRDEVRHFPLMFLGGTSGSGKTTTAQIASRFLGSSLNASLASITQFALIRVLAMSTTVPVFVDEWSLQSRVDARETIQAVVPILYEGGVTTRGRADLSIVEFKLTAPVLLAGEDSFHLDREAERMIALRLSRDSQGFASLQRLAGRPVERLAHWLYEWISTTDKLPPMPTTALTRPDYNRLILEAGWETLGAYLDHAREVEDVPMLPALDLSQLDTTKETRENEYEAFLLEGLGMRDTGGVPLVWTDERGTWVRFRMLTSHTNMSRVDVELPGRSRAMRQYFADRYELRDDRVTLPFSDKPVRATLIVGYSIAAPSEV